MPTTQATSGCLSALKAEGRNRKLAKATSAPIANVIPASWNAGIFPVATVRTDNSDHIRIAVSPISVAVRGVMGSALTSFFRHGRACPGPPRLLSACFRDGGGRGKPRAEELFLVRAAWKKPTGGERPSGT